MTSSQRFVWLDALRLTAGVSMIGLHATSDANGLPFADYPPADRVAPMLLRAVIYIARTELFMVIALFLLLMALDRRPRSYRQTIAEQARRLLLPFLFWVAFYSVFNGLKAATFGYEHDLSATLSDPVMLAGNLLLGDIKYHMHFLPTLFGIVLLYPLFRLAVRYPALALLVLPCLLVKRELDVFLYAELSGHPALPFLLRGIKILSYAGYGFVAGAALWLWTNHRGPGLQTWLPVVGFCGALLFLVKLAATFITIRSGAWPHGYTAGYWADFLMPPLLFLAVMCLGHRHWPDWICRLAPYSFGIYLCHPIFLDLSEIALKGTHLSPIAFVLLKIAIAVPLTSVLVVLISRTPGLGWTVGLGATSKRNASPGAAKGAVAP